MCQRFFFSEGSLSNRIGELFPGERLPRKKANFPFGHFLREPILSLRGSQRSQRFEADIPERFGRLAHFGGATPAMLCDPADQVVRKRTVPSHVRIRRSQ